MSLKMSPHRYLLWKNGTKDKVILSHRLPQVQDHNTPVALRCQWRWIHQMRLWDHQQHPGCVSGESAVSSQLQAALLLSPDSEWELPKLEQNW
jgi:hypothetical protein